MELDETKLPKYAQQVLDTLRREMATGRLTVGEVEFLRSAIKIKESWGIVGGFAMKFAVLITTLGTAWAVFGTWWKS